MENLKAIKKIIGEGHLSFIVGAGFSKNISELFPLWAELLTPMAKMLYPSRSDVTAVINEKTYLGLASEYVLRHGYHEAIDLYIEKQTPYLMKKEGDGYALYLDGKCIDEHPDLSLHEALLALNVKDIYTFNYDNALDLVGKTDRATTLQDELDRWKNEKRQLEKKRDRYNELYELLTKSWHETLSMPGNEVLKHEDNPYSEINNFITEKLGGAYKLLDGDVMEDCHAQNIQQFNQQINKYNFKIKQNEELLSNQHQLILNSYEISLTANRKNIYKLHGNLRLPGHKNSFGFDGDGHKQYVITQEDYDEYPRKHEAFVNLMKIALLKGSFCLLGFSGDDPNFLMWISWVKDVLDRNPKEGRRASIYFIHVGDKEISEEKMQLFSNNYITPIVLKDIYGVMDEKEQMRLFLGDITPKVAQISEYSDLWRALHFKHEKADFTEIQKQTIDKLYSLTFDYRLPLQNGLLNHYRMCARAVVAQQLNAGKRSPYLPKLAFLATKDELLLLHQVFTAKQIEQLKEMISKEDDGLLAEFERHQLRSGVLSIDKNQRNISFDASNYTYESIWALLFQLKFSKAKKELIAWKPKETFDKARDMILKKMFEIGSEFSLESILQSEEYRNRLDYNYLLNFLPAINGLYFEKQNHPIILLQREEQKKSVGVKTYQQIIDDLLSEFIEPDDITSYGNARKVLKMDGGDSHLLPFVKVLNILIELARFTDLSNVIFLDKKRWMLLCEKLMNHYPYPCLFFTLLYGNDKTLMKKVAQLYLYSPTLLPKLPEMLRMMLNALLDHSCPYNIRVAIHLVAPTFMKAVPPDKWQKPFEKLFRRFDWSKERLRHDLDNELYFFKSSMPYIKDRKFKLQVMISCLQQGERVDHFCNEMLLAVRRDISISRTEVPHLLLQLLKIANDSAHFYVLLNMSSNLPKKALGKKLLEQSDSLFNDISLLYGIAHFSKAVPELQARIRNFVVNSRFLWETGIHKDGSGVSSLYQYLDVNQIQLYVNFSDDELVTIFSKLINSLVLLEKFLPKWMDKASYSLLFNDWLDLIYYMCRFVENNRKILTENACDCSDVMNRLDRLKQQYGHGSIIDNLLNDENTIDAIAALVNSLTASNVSAYMNEYVLIVNKIILQNSQALNACFRHLAWVMTKYRRFFSKRTFAPLLNSLFRVYEPYFHSSGAMDWNLYTVEKEVAEASLMKLAAIYESWGYSCFFGKSYQPVFISPV